MNRLLSLKQLTEKLSKSAVPSSTPHHHHLFKPYSHSFSSPTPKPNSHFLSSPPHQPPTFLHGSLFSNPVLAKHFASAAGPTSTSTSTTSRLWSLKTQLPKFKPSNWSSSSQKRRWSSWSQGYSADNIVLGLIVVNTAVFLMWRAFDRDFMYKNFTISVDNIKSGRIHTLITSAFSHIDMEHIGSNMIGLYFFGSNIGRMFGPEYLLKLYLAGAVVGSLFYVVHHAFLVKMFKKQGTFWRDPSKTPGLGASGAVNAILLLDIFLFPKATLLFDFFIPVPAILLGVFLIGKDLVRMLEGDQQISGSAHLGGAAVAAAAWLRLKKGRGFRF